MGRRNRRGGGPHRLISEALEQLDIKASMASACVAAPARGSHTVKRCLLPHGDRGEKEMA